MNAGSVLRLLCVGLLTIPALACLGNNPEEGVGYSVANGGSPVRGRRLIREHNCGSCHTIPGINEARGVVAPPLFWFSRRTFIAGEIPNTPANLARWVQSPESIEPATAMPTLGLSEQDARDVAAYLGTLR